MGLHHGGRSDRALELFLQVQVCRMWHPLGFSFKRDGKVDEPQWVRSRPPIGAVIVDAPMPVSEDEEVMT
jgi:hypothetical protein